ncbi:hypothetical protein [Enterovibrio paralichthyis]|uniref:hypothetical protein n=1 Tax=Enterovibrio paralichthyis TaxID=2853805 RepID=UPI001C4576E3|nr:hypothetical protein [Enterovibrio paralichthyis]MBV7298932.1 hypothetical protein [Enterovibrio paralichthyis]
MNFELKANQPYPVTISGTWVWLKFATAEIVMETNSGERVSIPKGSVVKNDALLGRVLLHSPQDQIIDIQFGKGDFQPPTDGQRVVIESAPPLEIAPNQSVDLGSVPALTLESGQSVKIESLPPVEIASNQYMAVSLGTRPVTLKKASRARASGGNLPMSIPYRSTRIKITIKADANNTGDVIVNGAYPLSPSETIELEYSGVVELTGAATDSAYVMDCY